MPEARMRREGQVALMTLAAAAALCAPGLEAQQRTTIGAYAGVLDSRQIGDRDRESRSHGGLLLGVWADVATPKPLLHVTVEGGLARRGGDYTLNGVDASATVDYLAVAVLPRVRFALGPAALFVEAGPSLDLTLRESSPAEVATGFGQTAGQVVGLLVGGGVEVGLAGLVARIEARLHEQLGDGYLGAQGDVGHRSKEVVVRVGR